jgi:HEAT repeat protein
MKPRPLARLGALALAWAALGAPALGAQQTPLPDVPRPPKATPAPSLDKTPLPPGQLAKPPHDDLFEKSRFEKSRFELVKPSVEPMKVHDVSLLDVTKPTAVTLPPGQWPADVKLHGGQWYQGDPADSAYRAAYALFSRQEYRAAAERFSEVRSKYPSTRYLCDAAYYEAFARYRLGTPNDLRTAYRVLDGAASGGRCADASRREDVPELQARIDAVLARLGDGEASERVRRAASQGRGVCDREERNVKIQALSALAQMDPEGAKPILATVLNLRDDCSAAVRREALQLVARNADAAAIAQLARTARTDPDPETQGAAVEWLSRVGTDPAYSALEELMRTSTDERTQSAAARAMARSDNPRAQSTVRALAERKDVSERLRAYVIQSMASNGSTPTEYWRALYGKVESDELRRAIVNGVNRTSDEGQAFLLSIARNANESSSVRELAISRVRQTAPIADLYRLFETADTRSMRQSIVSGLAARREPEATDRLIDIAKRGTDPEVRATAIRYLGQPARRDDPKVRKALADILGGQT